MGQGRKSGLWDRIKRRRRSRPGFPRSSPIVVGVVVASRSTGKKKERKEIFGKRFQKILSRKIFDCE